MSDLRKIFTDGNLVDVNVKMWTGERTLQPEDLGLNGKQISKAFKLGKKALIPNDVIVDFRRIDQKARGILIKYSFPFVFGGSRFVPKKTFVKFAEEFEEVRVRFEALVNSLIQNYDKYRIDMRKYYVEAAKSAHMRMVSIRKIEIDENKFINDFLERVDTFYPPIESLRARYSLDYAVFQVALPDLTQASYDDLMEEGEKIQMLQQAKQRELQQRVSKFIDDTLGGMREKASTAFAHLEGLIRDHRKITKASFRAVSNMIDDYVALDIIGDADFIHNMLHFKKKHLQHLDKNVLRLQPNFAQFICDELRKLVVMAEDRAAIQALIVAYKQKIDI